MARMVDISDKPAVRRQATAAGVLRLRPGTLEALRQNRLPKGDALATARVAAIQAVKGTPRILPLCHPLPLTGVETVLTIQEDRVEARVTVRTTYGTGVEMEALTGVAAALLCLWDMVKALEKDPQGQYPETRIEELRVVSKEKEVRP